MSPRVLAILLVAAVVSYPMGLADGSESSSRDTSLQWSGQSSDPAPEFSSQAAPKAPGLAPLPVETAPPSEELLPQRPSFEDWGRASRLGGGARLIRAPPFA